MKKKPVFGQLDFFPPTTYWTPPTELPDWTRRPLIAIDTETKDDGLSSSHGAGWALPASGHIVGVSMAVSTSERIYVSVRHPESPNFPVEKVKRWVRAHMEAPVQKVFHNAVYDLGWLETDFDIATRDMSNIHDTLAVAVMLDENRNSYSLDNLCIEHGIPSKNERKLREAAVSFGIDAKKELWKLQAKYVAEYAEQDALSTLLLFQHLYPLIEQHGLTAAYRLEIDLIPLVNLMRRRGIRIDEDRVEQGIIYFQEKTNVLLKKIKEMLGLRIEVTPEHIHSAQWLAYAFREQGLAFPTTPKTHQGQFRSEWLLAQEHPFPQLIANARSYYDGSEKFIKQYIKEFTYNGRIHSEIHHIRSDDGGTRSYRFSYSSPPLQQISADEEFGPIIRGCFRPEQGCSWGAFDLKGQEPTITVHTADEYGCIGAAAAVEYYRTDPNPDYHTYVALITGIPRARAKIINLSLTYGMGLAELCRRLGISEEAGIQILALYHARMPFISQLTKMITYEADTKGYITLLDGARCRFDKWEPRGHRYNTQAPAPSIDVARARWPGQALRRAETRKALNRKIQGGAARQIKLVMRECYNQGIYPLLQVHDELDFNLSSDAMKQQITRIMCETVQLRVPTRTDVEIGASWGEAVK